MKFFEYSCVFAKVFDHFEHDLEKTKLWFESPNPLLGNVSPNEMIKLGRVYKLAMFIDDSLAMNLPDNEHNEED